MGTTITKTNYTCDCGENYGSCGVEAGFVMVYNRSCDLGTIWHYHGDKAEPIGTYTDGGLAALNKLLDDVNLPPLSTEDKEQLKRLKITK